MTATIFSQGPFVGDIGFTYEDLNSKAWLPKVGQDLLMEGKVIGKITDVKELDDLGGITVTVDTAPQLEPYEVVA